MKRSLREEHYNKQATGSWRGVGGLDSSSSNYGFIGNSSASVQELGLLDDLKLEMLSPSLEAFPVQFSTLCGKKSRIQGFVDANEKILHSSALASLELLNEYGKGFKRLKIDVDGLPGASTEYRNVKRPVLSTEEIMRVAGSRFIQSSATDRGCIVGGPYDVSFSDLSEEEAKAVELAELLLAAAEKVGEQQFDRARNLLNQCDELSSDTGNAIERVIYYFSKALRERIDTEMRKKMSIGLENDPQPDIDEALMIPNSCISDLIERIPFYRPAQLAGVQAIIESVGKAKKIHIIDFKIRNGAQWAFLMQAISAQKERCPLELLKVTAVGTGSRNLLVGTGNRLMSFAQTMGIPFLFNIVMMSTWVDVKQESFEIAPSEAVAIYSEYP